jgi:hypothetical protein
MRRELKFHTLYFAAEGKGKVVNSPDLLSAAVTNHKK